jgi:hypothetical protein
VSDLERQLGLLLDEAAPEPHREISLEAIAGRVRARRAARVLAPVAVAMLVVAIAAVGFALDSRSNRHAAVAGPSRSSRPSSAAETSTPRLPRVVDGVPVARLAREALDKAIAWSDPHPTRVRAVLTTWGRYHPSSRAEYRSDLVYIVALDGRFTCLPLGCARSNPGGRAAFVTPAPGSVPQSHMLFTVAVAGSPSPGSDLRVGRLDRDLSKLGHVLDLQPYVDGHR